MTISRPVRIFALVAVIAVVGGVGMLMLKPKKAAAPPVVVQSPALTTSTKLSTEPAAKAGSRTAPPTSRHRGPVKKASSVVAANGLPMTIDAAFRKHRIVVVSVFNPQAPSDAISYAEARAGASDAGAGFVGISLLDNPLASALTTSLPGGGLLPDPGVLIYRRPGLLVQRLDGFADRDIVAQATAASVTAVPLTAASVAADATAPSSTTTPAP
ncbi:MAG: hypothetical protein ACRDNM_08805 [Gaiellaceae bacterium]